MKTRRRNRRIRRSKNTHNRNKTRRVLFKGLKRKRHTKPQNVNNYSPFHSTRAQECDNSRIRYPAGGSPRRIGVKLIKGGDEGRIVLLTETERKILKEYIFTRILQNLNSLDPNTAFDDNFLDVMEGKADITTEQYNKVALFRAYLIYVYYVYRYTIDHINANTLVAGENLLQILRKIEEMDIINVLSRLDMFFSSVYSIDALKYFKNYLFSMISSKQPNTQPKSNSPKRNGIHFDMLVYPDLSNPKMIETTPRKLRKNPERIFEYRYNIEGEDPQKNAEHALNVMFYSPYLLETKGKKYVDLITTPITKQSGDVLYQRTTVPLPQP